MLPRNFGIALWFSALMAGVPQLTGARPLNAQEPELPLESKSPFEVKVFTSASGETLPYRILSPELPEPDKKYPLVLFLHGAGERGVDNERQLIHVAQELATPAIRGRYPAYVLVPQCPENQQWVNVPWSAEEHTQPEEPSNALKLVMELIDSSQATLPIDQSRIYYTGLSMGGFGVWDLAQRQPGQCAAVIAICGGGDEKCAAALTGTPIWAFHGETDTVVKPHRSRNMVEAIRAAGGNPIYTEYAGVGHNSWTQTAKNPLVWDWLFAQSRR